jgi:hypothetical protein
MDHHLATVYVAERRMVRGFPAGPGDKKAAVLSNSSFLKV